MELRNRIRPVANRRINSTIAYAFLDKKRPLSEWGRMEGTGRKPHVDSQIDATRNAKNIVSSLGHGDRLFRLGTESTRHWYCLNVCEGSVRTGSNEIGGGFDILDYCHV